MPNIDVIRAWKDELYRAGLNDEELAHLPEHPAGFIELEGEQLANVEGGTTIPCIALATAALSCHLACDGTIDGTCGIFSIGCCGESMPVEPIPTNP